LILLCLFISSVMSFDCQTAQTRWQCKRNDCTWLKDDVSCRGNCLGKCVASEPEASGARNLAKKKKKKLVLAQPPPVPLPRTSSSYEITLIFASNVGIDLQAAFYKAKARYEAIITQGLNTSAAIAGGVVNCWGVPSSKVSQDLYFEDLAIFVSLPYIDGQGGVLGESGFCQHDAKGFPRVGTMQLDIADAHFLLSSGQWDDCVLHEMSHVIGVGTHPLWHKNIAGNQYKGAGGVQGNIDIDSYLPFPLIQTQGAPGSAFAHWDEIHFQDELMTGYLNVGPNPMSKLTIETLMDFGYSVDPSQADDFEMPFIPGQGRRVDDDKKKLRTPIGADVLNIPSTPAKETPRRQKIKKNSKVQYSAE